MATGYASSTNFEIDLMAKINMPYLVSANSAQTRDIIAKAPDKYPTVWSLTPSYDAYETQVLPVIQGLEKQGLVKLPNKKLAIVSSDNPYSKTIFEGIKRSFTRAGWTITVQDLLPFGEINDWRAFLAKVRNDPPAVLINTDYVPANAATFMTQFLENPTNSLVFIQYAPSVPEFLDLTKGKSSGVLYNLLGGVLNTPGNPRAAVVLKKFKDEYKVESGSYGAALYESVLIYADALRRVKDPTNRLAIGRALGATNKQIASGRLVFDPKTHLARQGDTFIPLQFYQLWEGNRVLINPTRYATGKFQAPPWMKR
jgi:branched-chain amino acid transport system substrate-binding protein